MKGILPIIIICIIGISLCFGLLIYYLVRFLMERRRKKIEEFEFEENTLTISLSKNKKKKPKEKKL